MWEDAWREARTGWDTGMAAPALVELLARETLPSGRALVPGCGRGYDVFALAQHGYDALGLDLAPTAARCFEAERENWDLTAGSASIEVGSFFEFAREGEFQVIFDYTFLCAIEPGMRETWARQMKALLAPGGELVTLIFPVREDDGAGPPYAMSPDLVRGLLLPDLELLHLEPVDASVSHPARAGKEWLGRWRRP